MVTRNYLSKGRGFPNALEARDVIARRVKIQGYPSLAAELGISKRYLRLILCGERMPVHQSILDLFGWEKVYEVQPEDDI